MSAVATELVDDLVAQSVVTDDPTRFRSALEYEAPYLIEKLLKEKIVDTAADGEALFCEVKRYLVLAQLDRTVSWSMYSTRVDAVWHQFVLFTREYHDFCTRHLGAYVHHAPTIATGLGSPEIEVSETISSAAGPEATTFRAFGGRYRSVFGEQLPDLWVNAKNVAPTTRIINDDTTASVVSDADGMVSLIRDDRSIVMSVNDIAAEAVDFIAVTATFFVRELPGELTDDEKVGIVATLVERGVLRLAC